MHTVNYDARKRLLPGKSRCPFASLMLPFGTSAVANFLISNINKNLL